MIKLSNNPLAISSSFLPSADYEVLKECKDNGIDMLELSIGGVCPGMENEVIQSHWLKLIDSCKKADIKLWSAHLSFWDPYDIASLDKEVRKKAIERQLDMMRFVRENTDIKILNFSGGWSGTPDEENDNILWYDPEEDYILEAKISTFDGLFVCSAGNDNNNNDINPRYPSDYNLDNMITVGASVENDGIWSNSNFGMDTVDLFAPGDNIYSLSNSDWYCEESGTSMAAPFVTGVAAIMLSINPTLTPEEIKAFIMGNVDCEIVSDSGTRYPYIGKCVSGGRLNAYEAVNAMLEACVHSRVRYTNVSSSKHKKECLYCEIIISYENHTLSSVSLGYNKHTTSCTKCSYSIEEDHDLYLYADYGEDGFDVKCRDCSYTDGCSEEYEYYSTDEGHYISCSCGSVYFFDEHSPGTYTNINNVSHRIECYACDYIYTETHNLRCLRANNLYYHDVKCTDCTYNTTEAHNWIRRGTGYLCTICGQSEAFIPSDVMSLPDPELRIYLASLSDEDLDSFIASLPEDRLDRATALLPPENDDELSGE